MKTNNSLFLVGISAASLLASLASAGCATTEAKSDTSAMKAGEHSCGQAKTEEAKCGAAKPAAPATADGKTSESSCGQGSCGSKK